jgi:hypothetical protein
MKSLNVTAKAVYFNQDSPFLFVTGHHGARVDASSCGKKSQRRWFFLFDFDLSADKLLQVLADVVQSPKSGVF